MKVDLTGKIFGKLKVTRECSYKRHTHRVWLCQCACGKATEVVQNSLLRGATKSCGCGQIPWKHGHTINRKRSKEWAAWFDMKSRCSKKTHSCYKDYGARGISICSRWEVFENFLSDMGTAPPKSVLDRIDNDKGYTPSNCRWASPKQSSRNTRRTRYIKFNRKITTIPDLADRYGFTYEHLFRQIHRGKTPEQAIIYLKEKYAVKSIVFEGKEVR